MAPEGLEPLVINELSSDVLKVGKAVGACGFAHGKDLLEREGNIYRFAPLLQQGHISAIAPYDAPGPINELLLDMRGSNGMSGSPVFLPESGAVVGIVYESWGPATAFVLPLTPTLVEALLKAQQQAKEEAQQ